MIKKIYLLLLLLIIPSLVSASFNITGGNNMGELSTTEKFNCYKDYYLTNKIGILGSGEGNLLSEVMVSIYSGSDVLLNFEGAGLQSRNAWCSNKVLEQRYYSEVVNLTNNILKGEASYSDQIGLEDYYFELEKNQILGNVNAAWLYVLLLFELLKEAILLLFYFIQFYIVIYVLFIAFPKGFLYLRDGITKFMLKRRGDK